MAADQARPAQPRHHISEPTGLGEASPAYIISSSIINIWSDAIALRIRRQTVLPHGNLCIHDRTIVTGRAVARRALAIGAISAVM